MQRVFHGLLLTFHYARRAPIRQVALFRG